MALKFAIEKDEYSKLPEPLQKEYVEKNGKYVLSVEGVDDPEEIKDIKIKLAEFRDNNRKMHKDLEELRELQKKYENVDPDEYRKLKQRLDDLDKRGVGKPDDVQAAIDKALEPYKKKLEAEERARAEAQEKFINAEFTRHVSDLALKHRVRPDSVDLVVPLAKQKFEYKDGSIVSREGVKHPTEPHKDYQPTDWLSDLIKERPNLFETSEGSGAGGNRGRKPAGKVLINPTPEDMGRLSKEIASGEVRVERTT